MKQSVGGGPRKTASVCLYSHIVFWSAATQRCACPFPTKHTTVIYMGVPGRVLSGPAPGGGVNIQKHVVWHVLSECSLHPSLGLFNKVKSIIIQKPQRMSERESIALYKGEKGEPEKQLILTSPVAIELEKPSDFLRKRGMHFNVLQFTIP